jgi:hypothetical protein
MHAVIRTYSGKGASELFEALGQNEDDVKELITGVPGFLSYAALMVDDATGVTVTVCEEKEGTDESSKRAAEWVKENVDTEVDAPTVTEGDTILQF